MTKNIEINAKSTKNEILDAYQETLQQLKTLKKTSRQEVKREQEKQTILGNVLSQTTDDIVQELASLKLSLVKSLEELENQLLNEHKKLATLQQAIAWQSQEIEALHEIKVNTETLGILLHTQKEKKEAFEEEMREKRHTFDQEMIQKRSAWKQEQEDTITTWKEQEAQQKKLRHREEEDTITNEIWREKKNKIYIKAKSIH